MDLLAIDVKTKPYNSFLGCTVFAQVYLQIYHNDGLFSGSFGAPGYNRSTP